MAVRDCVLLGAIAIVANSASTVHGAITLTSRTNDYSVSFVNARFDDTVFDLYTRADATANTPGDPRAPHLFLPLDPAPGKGLVSGLPCCVHILPPMLALHGRIIPRGTAW